jgi:hypothetical protein
VLVHFLSLQAMLMYVSLFSFHVVLTFFLFFSFQFKIMLHAIVVFYNVLHVVGPRGHCVVQCQSHNETTICCELGERLWRTIEASWVLSWSIPKFLKLGEMCLVLVIGSMEDVYYASSILSGSLDNPRGDHWAKIVEQRAIKNRVQYIHCR